MNNILGVQDLIAVPITLAAIYVLAALRFQKYKDTPLAKYFFLGLHLKLLACFAHFAYHAYIYGGGDTFQYYNISLLWVESFRAYPSETFWSLFQSPETYDYNLYDYLSNIWYRTEQERRLLKITGPLALFTFSSFLSIGLWLSFFAYWGIWRIFKVFADLYPDHIHIAALSTLFIPSVVFWASSLSKDSLTMGCTGLILHGLYILFIARKPRKPIFAIILTLLPAFYLLSSIKGYILVGMLPAFAIWVLLIYRANISNPTTRFLITPIMIAVGLVAILFLVRLMANTSTFETFTSDAVFQKVYVQNQYLSDASRAGSAYNIGTIEPNFQSVLRIFPQAVNVALFRPYIWEANGIAALLAALESTLALGLMLLIIFRLGISKLVNLIFSQPFLMFCIIFSIIFGAAMGLTSGNFGTLTRYKIPMVSFFFFTLLYLYSTTTTPPPKKPQSQPTPQPQPTPQSQPIPPPPPQSQPIPPPQPPPPPQTT